MVISWPGIKVDWRVVRIARFLRGSFHASHEALTINVFRADAPVRALNFP